MGFKVSKWDETLLAYGEDFERDMMDLNVNMPIEQALDRCWEILAKHLRAGADRSQGRIDQSSLPRKVEGMVVPVDPSCAAPTESKA